MRVSKVSDQVSILMVEDYHLKVTLEHSLLMQEESKCFQF